MNTPSSSLPTGSRDSFDTGPLSWVIGEISEALMRSRVALVEALEQDDDTRSSTLRQSRSWLHQAHGALQIVDIDGVVIITETVEDLFDRFDAGQLALDAQTVEAVSQAYQALNGYLEELMAGMSHQPVRLFPYYRALLEARGAERIHPADLFFPNLAIRPQLPSASQTLSTDDYLGLRKRFERSLLSFLKSGDGASATAMRDIVLHVESAQGSNQARAFWWVMSGFADAVAQGQIPAELYVKQLFARINLQLRRLSEGSVSIAERLLRDALFFLARIEQPSQEVVRIRAAYELDGVVPTDYEKRRYGQIDAAALQSARERLSQAKTLWNRIAGGDAGVATAFQQEMTNLADFGGKLGSPALAKLLRELSGIARPAAHATPGDTLSLEVATALLFVDNALQQIAQLSENFSERADAVSARLVSAVAGEPLEPSAQWLDEMSREAQQRQTMNAVSAELQTNLRQVEKQLDAYFRDPEQPHDLGELDGVLHQIGGAMFVLDQPDAARAVEQVRNTVREFAASEEAPSSEVAEKVAQNVGALGFFIETLQLHGDGRSERFEFDDASGLFRARLTERREFVVSEPVVDAISIADLPAAVVIVVDDIGAIPTVEDELVSHQHRALEIARSLAAEPGNAALQEQLKESLEQVRQDARLIDNPDAGDRARTLIDKLESADFVPSQDTLDDIANVAEARPTVAVEELTALVSPETEEEVDAELLDIFLTEAVEVLDTVAGTLPLSRNAPHQEEHLITLRRAFHTLKGSGRMVGLNTFGEAAWSIEQVMNVRLSESRGGDDDLYALLDKAAALLGTWVEELRRDGRSARDGQSLIDAANRVKEGDAFSFMQDQDVIVDKLPVIELDVEDALPELQAETAINTEIAIAEPEEVELSDEELAQFGQFAESEFGVSGETQLSEEIQDGASEFEGSTAEDVVVASDEVTEDDTEDGIPVVADIIDFPGKPTPSARTEDGIKRIGDLEISLPLHTIYLTETDELVRRLVQDFSEWRHEPERHVSVQAVHAAHSLAGSSATVGFTSLHLLAHALEMVLQYLARNPVKLLLSEYDVLDESMVRVRDMLQKFAQGEMPEPETAQQEQLEAMLEDFDFRVLPASDLPVTGHSSIDELLLVELVASAEHIESIEGIAPVAPISQREQPLFEEQTDPALIIRDEIDTDLLPVFVEEGKDMLPQIGEALRAWQRHTTDIEAPQALLRLLHTVKGSARMAGAMTLGQHMHEMETRIENIMHAGQFSAVPLEDLLTRYDHAVHLFDALQRGEMQTPIGSQDATTVTEQVVGEIVAPVVIPTEDVAQSAVIVKPAGSNVVAAQTAPLVRVRADILDRLVNQAGEVSISRSKLETEVGTIKQSLGELSDNVSRLRDQLREIEMQAESQISSNMGTSADREFDPLEFDRFTRLQELTRMMAESVSDVGTVQQTLSRTIDSASNDLGTQARLTRDLQQDLMRVRMVQFASISERLFRVTRQTAKELDKRVNLDIRGSAVEIDRSVLEKMTGPFEHLLRNAIVHGIESREKRLDAGKNEMGELRIEVRQEGNEVVIQFSDDGQGLNVANIRNKATQVGLLTDESQLSDSEVSDLIFHPGFSTAEEVTELAGRGVGMDVVRSEAASLGGRISTISQPGAGAQFTIHLPLTLAVTQVVLLSTGGRIYAVPSVLVEQVQHLKSGPLTHAYNEGGIQWQSQRVPLHYLSALLGDTEATPVTQQYSPIMILKSGSDRVALHVDEVVGNREVVVKNIGPQLSRLIGIAGATVLGSGEIVLILNPVPLAQRVAAENLRVPHMSEVDAPQGLGAVAEMQGTEQGADPVQGLRSTPIVMVVDDSLTVRRVTQRLLAREGYQVVLAKDGVDALQHLQSITPDVMLVDIEMPRMDGFDLTRNVRGDERTRDIPIVMITSRTAAKHRNVAMELGVNEYLGKPYQEERLLELIAGFVGRASMLN